MTMITTTTGRIHLRDYDDANIHQSRGGPPKPAPLPTVKTPRAMTAEYQALGEEGRIDGLLEQTVGLRAYFEQQPPAQQQ